MSGGGVLHEPPQEEPKWFVFSRLVWHDAFEDAAQMHLANDRLGEGLCEFYQKRYLGLATVKIGQVIADQVAVIGASPIESVSGCTRTATRCRKTQAPHSCKLTERGALLSVQTLNNGGDDVACRPFQLTDALPPVAF